MTNGTLIKTAMTALAILVPVLLMACGDGDKELSRADVAKIVRSELAEAPASADPGPSREEIEQIVSAAIADIPERDSGPTGIEAGPTNGSAAASIPPKSTPGDYTRFFVNKAISRYGSEGLDATLAYYNTRESVDGQWYVFIIDQDDTMVAHAANPNLVGRPASAAMGPNSYPAGEAVAAVADEDGAWFDYTFPNPATGGAETKHSWTVRHDGLVFTSGWYERGPRKSDAPPPTPRPSWSRP